MKEIKAIIQPFMLSKVISALKEIEGFPGVTVDMSVCGFGRGRATHAKDKLLEDSVEYVKKVKLEIVVPDHLAQNVVQIIQANAHTGNLGDGKIFVSTVDDVVRIRTGVCGEAAI
jgi:nitrogen regulatory protein PII